MPKKRTSVGDRLAQMLTPEYLVSEGSDYPITPDINELVDGNLKKMLVRNLIANIKEENANALLLSDWECPAHPQRKCRVSIDPTTGHGLSSCGVWCTYCPPTNAEQWLIASSSLPAGSVRMSSNQLRR